MTQNTRRQKVIAIFCNISHYDHPLLLLITKASIMQGVGGYYQKNTFIYKGIKLSSITISISHLCQAQPVENCSAKIAI